MRTILFVLAVTVAGSARHAAAQSVSFTAGHAGVPLLQFALKDQQLPGGRASLGVRLLPVPGLDLHLRQTTGFGPLGNVIIDVDAAGSIAGPALFTVAGRASLGPVALRLRPFISSGQELTRLRSADPGFQALPYSSGPPVWGVQLGASWRLSRDLMLVADPALVFGARGSALQLPLEVQLRAFAGPHDLRLLVTGLIPFTSSEQELTAWSAAGAGLRINRQRAAAWELWLFYGGNGVSQSPGIGFSIQEAVGGGTLLAGLRLEPYRSDLRPLQLHASWDGELDGLDVELRFELTAPEPGLLLSTTVSFPFD